MSVVEVEEPAARLRLFYDERGFVPLEELHASGSTTPACSW